ncbi:PepSY-associated TM helix domain-containing protein [Lysobacter sp. TAF61]|uniref:PepSY-associated TM helix domain-containing protein n=1 Tax=Lysobacter sp. TAF61 TaxID=3233072 RepID=UPI003F9CDA42
MSTSSAAPDIATRQQRRGFWLRTLHQWHWISSAICLVAMLLFSVTGITLNHSSVIEAKPETLNRKVEMPPSVLKALGKREGGSAPLPATVGGWLNDVLPVAIGGQPAEWSADEVYLSLPRPGGDAWLSIDRATGAVEYERTSRGWVAYLNDLHKGRNAGAAWRWFIDLFAIACLVFCITGLFLLQMHARQRPTTWPYVALGLVLPLLLALLFIH